MSGDDANERNDDTPRRSGRRRSLGLGALAGLCWALLTLAALPPVSVWWLGVFAPVGVVWVAWSALRAGWAAVGAAIGSLPLWVIHHAWVVDVSAAGVFPLVGYLALWSGLGVLVLARLRGVAGVLGPALVAPTAWVGLEFARGEVAFGGYAWFLAGHPMVESAVISRAAAVGGVYLVSWLVVAVTGVIVARRFGSSAQRRTAWGVTAVLVVLLALSVLVPRSTPAGPALRVAALQTDVPQSNKVFPTEEQLVSDFRVLASLMHEAAERGAGLTVTPETVLPRGLLDPAARAVVPEPFGEAMLVEQSRVGVPMLVGCTTLGGCRVEDGAVVWDDVFNSVFLLDGGEVVGPRYDKLRPTPFGETLPYVQSIPWLRGLVLRIGLGANDSSFGLTAGDRPVTFAAPTADGRVSVAVPICFESSMAPVVRRLVSSAREEGRPAQLLAVLTNDGWFGSFDAGRSMHLLQGRWRCIEHGLPMVRSANTGVSAVVDRLGRVTASLEPGRPGVVVGEVELGGGATAYQSVGDSVGWACFGATLLGLLASVGRGVGRGRGNREEQA